MPDFRSKIFLSPYSIMSMEMTNTASPSGHLCFPESINAGTVNIPPHRLRELFLDIQRFTAIAIIFAYHPDSPTELSMVRQDHVRPPSQTKLLIRRRLPR